MALLARSDQAGDRRHPAHPYGRIQRHRSDSGVCITTSAFTRDAIACAAVFRDKKILLIDANRLLARLMLDA
ncbi:MAG: hypothetical protein FJ049_05655 [Cyanobacteria bacterium M_surface_7_m2_037]|nr:hypothetical protein [Cyanobacteria bacterium M_surface_7_m2_037]